MESNILVSSKKVFKEHKGALYAIAQSDADNLIFAAGSDRNVIEFDLQTLGAKRLVAKSAAAVMSLLYFPKKKHLLIGQAEGGIHVVDLNENKEIHYLKIHKGYIFDLCYLEDKNEIVCSSGDGSISVWSAQDYSLLYHKKVCKQKLRKMDYSARRGELALACSDGLVRVLSIADYQEEYLLGPLKSALNTVRFNSINDTILVGEKDAHLRLYDLHTKNQIIDLAAHYWAIYDIAFSPNNKLFATASRDKTIKIWDTERMVVLKRIEGLKDKAHTHSVNGLYWSSFENYLLSIGDDGSLRIWSVS